MGGGGAAAGREFGRGRCAPALTTPATHARRSGCSWSPEAPLSLRPSHTQTDGRTAPCPRRFLDLTPL